MRYILLLFFITICNTTSAQRITNSPYPFSSAPDTLYSVNINGMGNSQQLGVVTLQGLLAKTKPRIMLQRGTVAFQQDLANRYGVIYDSTFQNDFKGLVNHFKPQVSGYILCTLNDSSTNVAISACSSRNAIAIAAADTALMDTLGIPMLLNVTGKNQQWGFDSLHTTFSDRIIGYQDATKCTFLSDYSVFTGAFHFYDPNNLALSYAAFGHLKTNSAALGWGDEHGFVSTASFFGAHVHAADWASNISTYTNFQVQARQKNHSADTTIIPGTHTVCFVMTDGDNVQWLLNSFYMDSKWYGSPNRGAVNIGWTISPALAELAPTVLKLIYDSAAAGAGHDHFIAAPSGMGYIYPSRFSLVDSAAAITGRMMQKADLSIVNIIDDNFTASIDATPYLTQPNIDGVFFYTYGNAYSGMNGYAGCYNGKPLISARYTMWTGYETVASLAAKLNAASKKPDSTSGYSLVDVNVWGNSVDSVIACARLLDSTVRVVTPDAFVKLFKIGVNCTAVSGITQVEGENDIGLQCSPNPMANESMISYTLAENAVVHVALYDANGKEIKALFTGLQNAGAHQLMLDVHDLSAGAYILSVKGGKCNASIRCGIFR